jgi:spermidine synthase
MPEISRQTESMAARRIFLGLYLLSGTTSLLYQVVWSRLLTLEMGQTAAAVSTVLAAFMGGQALGAALAGRAAPHLPPRRALSIYAGLELLVCLAALAVGPLLTLAHPLLQAAYDDGNGGPAFVALRLAICLLVVTLPATAMGATFPIAVRWLECAGRPPGRTAGQLYAANTLGAAGGAALAGFALLPTFGLTQTTLIGVALNIIVALGALLLSRADTAPKSRTPFGISSLRHLSDEDDDKAPPATRTDHFYDEQGRRTHSVPRPRSAAALLAISGCVALIYEVAWTRLLALTIGPTTYAFSAMLMAFILGLAVGAAIASRLLARIRRPIIPLAVTQILAALGAFGAAWLVPWLPQWAAWFASSSPGYVWLLLLNSAAIVLLLAPMTLALGAAFPFAVAAAAPPGTAAARAAARVYTANTLGAIAGALVGGFFLIPTLGLQRTIVLAGAVATIAGVELIWRTRRGSFTRTWVAGFGTLSMIAGLMLPDWDRKLLSGGPYSYAQTAADVQLGLDAGALLYYGDGSAGTVAVRRIAGETTMSVNGRVEASDAGGMLTQKLLAHLPLLLHPAPHDICIVGLGSGVTAGAALAHPVDRVDTIELSKEVVSASAFFVKENHDALQDPRGHVVIGDGRSHLRLARRRYDVIVSEPSTPWMAGVASLFTREFFVAARDRLNTGGLFCQWAHTHDISRQDLTSILATFTDVFPGGSLWLVGETDVLLIGGREPIEPLIGNIAGAWSRPGVAADLARVDVRDPFSLLSLFVAQGSILRGLSTGAPVQTDDRTALEFSAPRGLYDRADQGRWLVQLGAQAVSRPEAVTTAEALAGAPQWRDRAIMLMRADAYGLAYDAAVRSLSLDPSDADALETFTRAAIALGRYGPAVAVVQGVVDRQPGGIAPLVALSRLQAAAGQTDAALRTAEVATRTFPDVFAGWDQLAAVATDAGREQPLADALAQMRTLFGDRWKTRYHTARWHLMRGEYAEAARLGEAVLAARPGDPHALALAGAAYIGLGVRDRAREAFEASISSDPRDPVGYLSLARLELDTFNPQRAAALFTEALFLDPRSVPAMTGLADAFASMGRPEQAAELRARAGAL